MLASYFLATVNVQAADSVPLPIKKISLDSADQVVIQFAVHAGAFPVPPHVLELPGPDHRIVLDFQNTVVDRVNMPGSDELSERLHRLFPLIKGVRYTNLTNSARPTARVVIEVPEQLEVKPRVVKLEEDSITISLGDNIKDQDIPLESSPEEPAGTTNFKMLKKNLQGNAKDQAVDVASAKETAAPAQAADVDAASGAGSTSSSATTDGSVAATVSGDTSSWDWTKPLETNVSDSNATAAVTSPAIADRPVIAQAGAPTDVVKIGGDQPASHGTMEVTESTESFSKPATIIQPGAQTVVSPAAAQMLQKPEEPAAPKPATVAETDAKDFQDVLKPAAEQTNPLASGTTGAADETLQLKPPIAAEEGNAASNQKADTASQAQPPSRTEPPSAVGNTPWPSASKAAAAADTAGEAKIELRPNSQKVETAPSGQQAGSAVSIPAVPKTEAGATPSPGGEKAAVQLYNNAVKAHLSGNLAQAIADYKGAERPIPNWPRLTATLV